jgi:hypothetical protein
MYSECIAHFGDANLAGRRTELHPARATPTVKLTLRRRHRVLAPLEVEWEALAPVDAEIVARVRPLHGSGATGLLLDDGLGTTPHSWRSAALSAPANTMPSGAFTALRGGSGLGVVLLGAATSAVHLAGGVQLSVHRQMMSDDGHGLGRDGEGGGGDLSDSRPGRLAFQLVMSAGTSGTSESSGSGGSSRFTRLVRRSGSADVASGGSSSTEDNAGMSGGGGSEAESAAAAAETTATRVLRQLAVKASRPVVAFAVPVGCPLHTWSALSASLPPHVHVLGVSATRPPGAPPARLLPPPPVLTHGSNRSTVPPKPNQMGGDGDRYVGGTHHTTKQSDGAEAYVAEHRYTFHTRRQSDPGYREAADWGGRGRGCPLWLRLQNLSPPPRLEVSRISGVPGDGWIDAAGLTAALSPGDVALHPVRIAGGEIGYAVWSRPCPAPSPLPERGAYLPRAAP